MEAAVVGNVNLDVICAPVDDVPRFDAISFENAVVSPGGCGSNTAIGLLCLGVDTALIAYLGQDDAAFLAERYWERIGLDIRFVKHTDRYPTGVSIGLVDSQHQPRFIHSPGANICLSAEDLPIDEIISRGVKALHIAGYFVLPGLLNPSLRTILGRARQAGILTSLDVVDSPRMADPSMLWSCLPEVDVLLCNSTEAKRLSEEEDVDKAARFLRSKGARAVVVKLGADGCWLEDGRQGQAIPGLPAKVVDTTGAGDAFSAGLIAA
ncbi:MAG TPA: carbohydrate kinase family protein, partial [Anaerolineales bacterium]